MALSEYEQRKLDEIECSLHSDDPALATILDTGVVGRQRRVVAAVIFVGGLVALIGGAVTALSLPVVGIVLSVLGFVAMGVGAGFVCLGSGRQRAPCRGPTRRGFPFGAVPGAPEWKSGSRLVSMTLASSCPWQTVGAVSRALSLRKRTRPTG